MGKNIALNGGIARLYKANTETHVFFGAVFMAKHLNPAATIKETVLQVIRVLSLEMDAEQAERLYYSTLNKYLDNGGI